MCQYHTLYHKEDKGHIIFCCQCNTIQLSYGNIMVMFCKDDFYSLVRYINRLAEEYEERRTCAIKCIVVRTPYEGINFLLTGAELYQFRNMVEEAETALLAQELISLFGN